jgi:DNA-directed RNA polymerase specialized sigma subunit
MTTKEVAQICGVTDRTVSGNAKKAGVVLANGKSHDWTDEEVKKLQLVLMGNVQNRGNASTGGNVVEDEARNALRGGLSLQVIMQSGNVEACKELCQMITEGTKAQHELLLAQEQNKLLLEQKEKAEKETERIYLVNRNFHTNLYTASQVAKKLGISANMVGRIANENGLKQDPIYGKLGKIQLNNGQWVNQFYYNDDALTVMEAVIG